MTDAGPQADGILASLAANEEAIAGLYRGYAAAFPARRKFWATLAGEEADHAALIRNLGAQVATRPLRVAAGRFNATAIQTLAAYLAREQSRLVLRQVPLIEALSITLYIEQSLLESRFFEVFRSDAPDLRDALARIEEETTAHRARAKAALAAYKRGLHQP